jgi:NAD(P) transhydrogenase
MRPAREFAVMDTYDLIAIGAGPAGESATELASFFGHRSAIVEKHRPGGTVTTTGGAPTKTLREAALYFSGFHQGDVYGLRMSAPPAIATDIIRKRTWSVCELLQRLWQTTLRCAMWTISGHCPTRPGRCRDRRS